MSKLPTLWFDKDGVLAKYDYSLYEGEYGAPAPWLVHNAHVFRNLEPYDGMCEAVRKLYKENSNVKASERKCNVRILTAVSDGVTLAEHVLDGVFWCSEHIGLMQRDFYACAVSKESIPICLRSNVAATDVLFDDYMPNLRKWKGAGGTAVKVLNGINSETDEFPCIATYWGVSNIYQAIMYVIDTISMGRVLKKGNMLPFV